MKTIIAGGRDYQLTENDISLLDEINITEVVSGGALGADRGGEYYAAARKIPVRQFIPEWNKYMKGAGFKRNEDMARYADACVLFPGGSGTNDMFDRATKHGLTVYDYRGNATPFQLKLL